MELAHSLNPYMVVGDNVWHPIWLLKHELYTKIWQEFCHPSDTSTINNFHMDVIWTSKPHHDIVRDHFPASQAWSKDPKWSKFGVPCFIGSSLLNTITNSRHIPQILQIYPKSHPLLIMLKESPSENPWERTDTARTQNTKHMVFFSTTKASHCACPKLCPSAWEFRSFSQSGNGCPMQINFSKQFMMTVAEELFSVDGNSESQFSATRHVEYTSSTAFISDHLNFQQQVPSTETTFFWDATCHDAVTPAWS